MRTCLSKASLRGEAVQVWALLCVAILGCLVPVNLAIGGTPATWTGGSGFWDDPFGWDLSLVPNNNGSTYDVIIGGAGDDVSLDFAVVVDTVDNAGTLRFLEGASLTLAQPGGLINSGLVHMDHSVVTGLSGPVDNSGFTWIESGVLELDSDFYNSGTVWLGDGSYEGGTAEIRVLEDLTFSGTGELYFYSASRTLEDQPLLSVPLGVELTNGLDHRIHGGAGRIEGEGTFINQGLIDADAPNRKMTIDLEEFANEGRLFARGGDLDVNVDSWHSSGEILIANNSTSSFSGSLLTIESGGTLRSVGGSELTIGHDVTNFGSIGTGGSGSIEMNGSNTLIINAPGASIDASAGTVRFSSTNGYVQNYGEMFADDGDFEFARGVDMFGGSLDLENSSHASVTDGVTAMTQVRTALDGTSSLGVEDRGTGAATLNFNGILDIDGGLLRAESESGGTATFNLNGQINDNSGTIQSIGGDFNVSSAFLDESGTLGLDIRNGGDISFTDIDSTAATIDVDWTGTGGQLAFSNYRKQDAPTHLDLGGWTGDSGELRVSGGTDLTGSGLTALAEGSTLTVTDNGTSLSLLDLATTAEGSLLDLASSGWFSADDLAVDGSVTFRGGTFDGNMTLNTPAIISIPSGVSRITGDLAWVGDREVAISGGSASLAIDGSVDVASGSSIRFIANATRLNGDGLLTNSGLIEGFAPSNNNSTYLDIDFVNNADGVIRAARNGETSTSYLQITGDGTNEGLMQANGAQLYFNGADVINSGTFEAVDAEVASKLTFLGGTTVTNSGGSTYVDGSLSTLEVSAAANVEVGDLYLTNGGTALVWGANSAVVANNIVDVDSGTVLTVTDSGRFGAAGIDLDGELLVRTNGVIDAPVTVNSGAVITSDSGSAYFNDSVSVVDGGLVSLENNGARIRGEGTITNSGLILGGAPANGNSTYLDNNLVNNVDGVVRASQNGTPTNTYLQILGSVDNAGLMEANGANLYFTGAELTNSGTLQAVQHVDGSKLMFLGGSVATDAGGSVFVDGVGSRLEVTGASVVDLGDVSVTNGAHGHVSDANTVLTADLQIDETSTFMLQNSAVIDGANVLVDGSMDIYNASVWAPMTISSTGQVESTYHGASYPARFEAPVLIENGGQLLMHEYYAAVTGDGLITNHGLIEGASGNNNYQTYLYSDVLNETDGIIRAGQNNGATNTRLHIYGDITNEGILEAEGAHMYFSGATIANSGTLRAVDHPDASKIYLQGGAVLSNAGGIATIDGALSYLEISGDSVAEFDTLSFTNGGSGHITGGSSTLTADTQVDFGSMFKIQNGSVLSGPALTVAGDVEVHNSTVNSPITITNTGELFSTYGNQSYPARLEAPVEIQNGGRLSMMVNSSAISGAGLITNSGVIEGAGASTNGVTYLWNTIDNNSDGVIRGGQNGTATGTRLQLYGAITNEGLMEANGGGLRFMAGSTVANNSLLQAVNGSEVRFEGGAVMTDEGASTFEINSGGTGYITGNNTFVAADVDVAEDSKLDVRSGAVLDGPAIRMAGEMEVYNATITAPLTVTSTGVVNSTYRGSGNPARFDAPVLIENGGSLMMHPYHSTVDGSGLITNHGLIEGAAENASYQTYLFSEVLNEADGVIRAAQNNGVTNTFLDMRGDITNAGMMEAVGANLYYNGSAVTNSGTIRAVDHADGSKIFMLGNTSVTDAGGTTSIDGALSYLEVSSGVDAELGELSFTNNGSGLITGSTTTVTANTTIDEGSFLDLRSAAILDGVGVSVAGELEIYNATVNAPLTIEGTGLVRSSYQSSAYPAVFNGDVDIESGGTLALDVYYAAVSGTGLVTNSGLITAGSDHASYPPTYFYSPLVNEADGVVRSVDNNGTGNGRFEIYSDVANAGLIEADGGDVWFMSGSSVANSGVLQATNGHQVRVHAGATVTDAGGSLLNLVDTGTGYITDAGTLVEASVNISETSKLDVRNSAILAGPNVQVDGTMEVHNATILSPVTISSTGEALSSYGSPSWPAMFNGGVSIESGGTLSMYQNSSAISGGLISNRGLIQGLAGSNGNTTYLYSEVDNYADGVIRAAQNGEATGTYMQILGQIDNAGLMEANGGNLQFMGSSVIANSGTLQAVAGSEIRFQDGATITDAGGGVLTLSDGGTGLMTGSGTRVDADVTIEAGSRLDVNSNSVLTGLGVRVDGTLGVSNATIDAPVTVGNGGEATSTYAGASYPAVFDEPVFIEGGGKMSMYFNSSTIAGDGLITNAGLIEGSAPSNGNTTFVYSELHNEATGVIRAARNGEATNTKLTLYGDLVNEGLLEADAAILEMSGITVDNTAGSWSAINGGQLRVSSSFVGGASGSSTTIDGDESMLSLLGGSLVGIDSLTLTNGGDVSVSGTNTGLFVMSPFFVPTNSVATVASSGRLQAGGMTIDGTLAGQGGTVVSDLHFNSPGLFDATAGVTIVEGDVTTTAGSLISATNGSTTIEINGTLDNALGSTVRLNTNTVALRGDELFTNAGLLEAGAFNNGNTVTMSKAFANSGEVLATSMNGATGTTFQITSPTLDNSGNMTASGADLTIYNSLMSHTGLMRAEAGNRLRIQSTPISGIGDVEIDGDGSLFDFISSSSATLGSLSLTNGGDANVTGSSSLTVVSPFTVGADSILTVDGSGYLGGGGIQVDNIMNVGGGTINAPTTISATGELFVTSTAQATFDGPVNVENGGRISIWSNSRRMGGLGTVTNSGVIEGGAVSNGYSTFLDSPIVNNVDGVIRALKYDAGTNTYMQFTNNIANSGLMEADGANLYFTGATVQNSGTIRAVDHVDGSKLIFLAGASVSDVGGATEVDGTLSSLQVSGGADAALGQLSFTNGATGYVTGNGSSVTADAIIGASSTFDVDSGAVFGGSHVQVDGLLDVYNATVTAPTTVSSTGELTSTYGSSSYPARLEGAVDVESGGKLSMYVSSSAFTGSGLVTNHGLIQGLAAANNGATSLYSPVLNASDGIVRAAQNETATGTVMHMFGSMTNEGLVEANGGNLRFRSGSSVSNSGTLQAVNGNEIRFDGGATVTDAGGLLLLSGGGTGLVTGTGASVSADVAVAAGSTLNVQSNAMLGGPSIEVAGGVEVRGGADAVVSSWSVIDSGTVLLTDSGSTLSGGVVIDPTASLTVANSGQVTVSATGMTNNGSLSIEGSGGLTADGPVVSTAGSTMTFATSSTLDFNDTVTIDGAMSLDNNLMTVDGDLTFGSTGQLQARAGGTLLLASDFINASEQNTDFDLDVMKLELATSFNALDPQEFEVAGSDLGADIAGSVDNFVLDHLLISGDDGYVQLVDNYDNRSDGALNDALYVSEITISDLGSILNLGQFTVYYGIFNGNLAQIDTSGGGQFIPMRSLLIPEPTTVLLLGIGVVFLAGRGGRSR